ncbi:MAG TPA: hypothetical protein VFL64_12570 [Rhizobacter sp.]|nr:hypothetical protein [Rhizobacter sp.]
MDTASPSSTQLNRRCALFTLLALSLAIAMGLLAWGPLPLTAGTHLYADARPLGAVAHGFNALMSLPLLLAGVWGWRALSRSDWPAALRTPWRLGYLCIALAGALAAAYHVSPGDLGYLAAQAAGAGAFTLLSLGFLAERVDARFGSRQACVAALGVVALATAVSASGAMDLRPLLLLHLLPVLLIPAGALSLPGRHTTQTDWLLMLGLYAVARLCDAGDGALMRYTGHALSGHALMHLGVAAMASRLAYRASRPIEESAEDEGSTQASTSLSTSG